MFIALDHCRLLDEMRRHPEARFRNTAAWLMGRTGDPRFALAFSELMSDADEFVRTQSFKGLGAAKGAARSRQPVAVTGRHRESRDGRIAQSHRHCPGPCRPTCPWDQSDAIRLENWNPGQTGFQLRSERIRLPRLL